MTKQTLLGKNLTELQEVCAELGFPKFTAKQLADWLYKKQVRSIDDMSNISAVNREKLNAQYEIGYTAPSEVSVSKDGTKKYLFKYANNALIESVYIPDGERATLCISSQSGCPMNCLFCATGKQGFNRNLTTAEIINQIQAIDETDKLTNIVYMGMGEPMLNVNEVLKSINIITSAEGYGWSPKRLTVSTVGVMPNLKLFLDGCTANLAVSVHAPTTLERRELVPAEKAHPIIDTLDLLRKYDWSHQRRLSFEYTLFDQINDTKQSALKFVEMLTGLDCHVNLIPYHKIPEVGLLPSSRQVMEQFQDILIKKNIPTTIRRSRGQDIEAACGMLAKKNS